DRVHSGGHGVRAGARGGGRRGRGRGRRIRGRLPRGVALGRARARAAQGRTRARREHAADDEGLPRRRDARMTGSEWFDEAFAGAPLMAILRGMGVERSLQLSEAAWNLGIDAVELPLQTEEDERALRAIVDRAAERGKSVG